MTIKKTTLLISEGIFRLPNRTNRNKLYGELCFNLSKSNANPSATEVKSSVSYKMRSHVLAVTNNDLFPKDKNLAKPKK